MIEVGSRKLKARLSYYLRLMEAGETIAVKIHNRIIGFLSQWRPPEEEKQPKKEEEKELKEMDRKIELLKKEGFIVSGGRLRHLPSKPVKTSRPGPSMSEIIRKMRDEEW